MFKKSTMNFAFSTVMIFTVSAVLLIMSPGCRQPEPKEINTPAPQQPVAGYNPYENADLSVEVFKVDSIEYNGSRGWGYDILIDGKIYIHQPNVPAIIGNNGFSSEEKAMITGEFVISKIKNNIFPPAVSPEELDSLGVLD